MAKKETSPHQIHSEDPTLKTASKNPLVFISHDTRDAELAEAFSQLLANSSMGILESFRSSDKKGTQGIEYGTLWYDEIFKKLNDASDVVCLLTNHSIDRPWILYEAGIAIGKSNTPLIGIALGIPLNKANNGPFAQFQNCSDDVDSLTKLISSLVRKIPKAKPIDEVIKGQVEQFLEKIKPILANKDEVLENNPYSENPLIEDTQVAKLFEEIKIMFQDLPSRIDRKLIPNEGRRFRKMHPMMLEEVMHFSKDESIGLLMILSLLKNEYPWIYDVGTEVLKNIKISKSMKEKDILLSDFERTLDMYIHSPFGERNIIHTKEDYGIYMELPHILIKGFRRLIEKGSNKE